MIVLWLVLSFFPDERIRLLLCSWAVVTCGRMEVRDVKGWYLQVLGRHSC